MKSRKAYLLSFGGWFSASPILEASTTMITPTFDFVALLPQFLHDQLQLWGWLFGRDMLRDFDSCGVDQVLLLGID